MNRGFALTIGLLAALAPAMAHAQTNIDQGKSASQIFANACAECHKSASALRKGKSAAAVAEFLREHYTTGREQAASLAAYVAGGRDTVAAPAPRPEAGGRAGCKSRPSPRKARPPTPSRDGRARRTQSRRRKRPPADTELHESDRKAGAWRKRPARWRRATAARSRSRPVRRRPQEPAAVAQCRRGRRRAGTS